MIGLISDALGGVRAGVGAIQANQAYKRQRGMIGRAYAQGEARLNLTQGDTRQSQGEGLIARGLANGGGVTNPGAVAPGTTVNLGAAHDLGSQAVLDERGEQALQQTGLATERDNAYSDAKANRTAGYVSAALNGVNAGINAFGAAKDLQTLHGPSGDMTDGGRPPAPFGGIDPIHPLGRGAWSPTGSTGGFNVFTGGNTGGMS